MSARFFCSLAFLALLPLACAEDASPAPTPTHAAKVPMEFDTFMLVLLVRPANAPEFAQPALDQLQKGHMANINRLAGEGKLFKAGPTEDHSGRNVRGIFLLKTESLEEARAWVATDPLIKAGRLVPEFMKWYVEKGSIK